MPPETKPYTLDIADQVIRSIFSWAVLMPISVIITGKFLAKPISFNVTTKQLFRLRFKVLEIQATGSEVILGFAGFIISLLLMGIFAGRDIYELVKANFGIDPGHFNALCMLASFVTVTWSAFVFLLHLLINRSKLPTFVSDPSRYDSLIAKLSRKENEDQQK